MYLNKVNVTSGSTLTKELERGQSSGVDLASNISSISLTKRHPKYLPKAREEGALLGAGLCGEVRRDIDHDGFGNECQINYDSIENLQPKMKIFKEGCSRCALKVVKYLSSKDESALKFTLKEKFEIGLNKTDGDGGRGLTSKEIESYFDSNVPSDYETASPYKLYSKSATRFFPHGVNRATWDMTPDQIKATLLELGDNSIAIMSNDLELVQDSVVVQEDGHSLVAYNNGGKVDFLDSTHRKWFRSALNEPLSYFSDGVKYDGNMWTWKKDSFLVRFAYKPSNI